MGEQDLIWKEYIKKFFVQMLEAVLPHFAAQRDTSREVVFLEKELQELALSLEAAGETKTESAKDRAQRISQTLVTDLLADVPLKGAEDLFILLHIEVQGRGSKKDINLRMYEYQQAIFSKHKRHAVGLLIATEKFTTKGELGVYVWEKFDTTLIYKFKVIKIYELKEDALLASGNIFDLLQLAALQSLKTNKDEEKKLNYAKAFIKLLLQRGFDLKSRREIMRFVERIIRIEEKDTVREYLKYVKETNKEEKKMLLLSLEEKEIFDEATQEAKLEGKLEGKLDMIKNMLKEGLSFPQITKFSGFNENELRGLLASQA